MYRPLTGLSDVPYVCLRLPTGGGKTLLAAHAVAVVRDAWIEKDWPMVLWLVPTNTIRRQTTEALKNRHHPYRRVLDDVFDGRVRVFDIADFTHIRPHDIRDQCCIVVGTIQTLRVTNTEGRKVYAHNEDMEPHFTRLATTLQGLETLESGSPKFSFANLMHLHRPLNDRGRGAKRCDRLDARDASTGEPLRHRRVHRDASAQLQHRAQRHSERAEGRGNGQAAGHAL